MGVSQPGFIWQECDEAHFGKAMQTICGTTFIEVFCPLAWPRRRSAMENYSARFALMQMNSKELSHDEITRNSLRSRCQLCDEPDYSAKIRYLRWADIRVSAKREGPMAATGRPHLSASDVSDIRDAAATSPSSLA